MLVILSGVGCSCSTWCWVGLLCSGQGLSGYQGHRREVLAPHCEHSTRPSEGLTLLAWWDKTKEQKDALWYSLTNWLGRASGSRHWKNRKSSLLGLRPSFISRWEEKEKKSYACLWFQHAKHGDPRPSSFQACGHLGGLQQRSRFPRRSPWQCGELGKSSGGPPDLVWVSNPHRHFTAVSS